MRRLGLLVIVACSGAVKAPKPIVAPVDANPDVPTGAAARRDAELAVRAGAYLDAFVNVYGTVTPDGKHLVFMSTRDGIFQVYVADAANPASTATRLFTTTEPIGSFDVTPDGTAVVFVSDHGGDENWSIFRVDIDGQNLVELTPGDRLARSMPWIPSGTPNTMYFTARAMADVGTKLYSAPLAAPGPATLVYSDEVSGGLAGMTPDGKIAFFTQMVSRAEMYLVRVDLATGVSKRLYPTDGTKVTLNDVVTTLDGKTLYVTTDAGGERPVVLAIDADTGAQGAKYQTPDNVDLAGVTPPRKGGAMLALTLNRGSVSEIVLLDARTLAAVSTVNMPLGQGASGPFTRDGKRLTATWSTPNTPYDLFSIDLATGAVSPMRDDPRPSLAGTPEIESRIVAIPAFDGGTIPANVYVAKGEAAVPHPTIVAYHGGPSRASEIHWSERNSFFISLGYAVVEPNVRGSTGYGRAYELADNGAKRRDALKDVETSARWVASQPWVDKDRMVVFGESYGGYTTLVALARWPDIWRAGVDMSGIVDLRTFMSSTAGRIHEVFLAELGDPVKDAELYAELSPITRVDDIVDPTFVYEGANDPRVPRSESDMIVKALRARNVTCEYMVAEDEGHSLDRPENQRAFYGRVARFLETALR